MLGRSCTCNGPRALLPTERSTEIVPKHCRRLDDGGDQDKALLAPLATPPLSTWNVAFPSRKPVYRWQDFFQLNLQYLKSVQTISSVGSSSSPSFPPHASPSSITAGMP